MKKKQPKYKSKFEEKIAGILGDLVTYEPDRINFLQPEKERYYLPDFKIADKVYIEAKGIWAFEDRQKHLWIKEQHPDIKIFFLFQNSNIKITKKSKTTYGDWATKNGFTWADYREGIPKEWLSYGNPANSRKPRRASRNKSNTIP